MNKMFINAPAGQNVYNPRRKPGVADTPHILALRGRNNMSELRPVGAIEFFSEPSPPVATGGYRYFVPIGTI